MPCHARLLLIQIKTSWANPWHWQDNSAPHVIAGSCASDRNFQIKRDRQMRWLDFNRRCQITHICGHVHWHRLSGRKPARQRQALFLSCRPCPSCSVKSTTDTLPASASQPLAELVGAEAARREAQAIRERLLNEIEVLVKSAELGSDPLINTVMNDLRSQVQAQWWLDRRDTDVRQLMAERGRIVLGLNR